MHQSNRGRLSQAGRMSELGACVRHTIPERTCHVQHINMILPSYAHVPRCRAAPSPARRTAHGKAELVQAYCTSKCVILTKTVDILCVKAEKRRAARTVGLCNDAAAADGAHRTPLTSPSPATGRDSRSCEIKPLLLSANIPRTCSTQKGREEPPLHARSLPGRP
jgi:hypothetical protein